MQVVAWIGGIMSVLGLAGVLWCIRKALWLRRAQLDDTAARAHLNRLIAGHMAAIGTAFLGLGLLVVGVLLS